MFSLAWSIVLFGQVPDRTALIGCALILTGGIALPLLSSVRRTDSIGPSAAQ
jgi:drug/metabolite transporter (DMT)-like permease